MTIQWNPQLEQKFVDGILEGKSIKSIAANVGIGEASFYRRRVDSPEFDSNIARVQEAAQEREVDNLLELADQADSENFNAIKLRIWARMWVAGKRKPKKYGDKAAVELTGQDGGPIVFQAKSILEESK